MDKFFKNPKLKEIDVDKELGEYKCPMSVNSPGSISINKWRGPAWLLGKELIRDETRLLANEGRYRDIGFSI